ncbi:phosphoserine aminotransferase [Terfezia boudieri ATCC MYA-4762]|uniref:phosphoserine transaminase n=1 Tax=Terfezia boudieri ATCC MYA-4762 TaxID=1051890 RepID=A0A3N4LHG0_9PEZI|nr:phosphoserine aminotransferase [Terfezia boudieri ATCC MYA-4762]
MPAREQVSYFGAGPARLPTSVLANASAALLNYNNTGLGIAEHSHRSALSSNILTQAAQYFKTLLNIPNDDSYTVIFMQGGGTTQFSSVVYNLVGYWVERRLRKHGGDLEKVRADLKDMKCEYLLTGGWSLKASQEAARLLGDEHVSIVIDARKANGGKWGIIPEEKDWSLVEKKDSALAYFCDNETVDGVEFPSFPNALESAEGEEDERLVIGDMSSNILSRPVDAKKYAVIFAGAQKNIGTTGITIVLIRKSILDCQPSPVTLRALNLPIPPIMMHYPTLASSSSLYNTLPIFDVYIAGEVMSQLLTSGGVAAIAAAAERKSSSVYEVIDKNPTVFTPVITDTRVRSRMNVCFRLVKGKDGRDLEKQFFEEAEKKGLLGIKGHRSVGGGRISCYNAVGEEEVAKLVAFMKEFATKQGHTYLTLN